MMKKFERVLDRLSGVISVISYSGIVLIMLITVVDVFLRFVYNRPIMGAFEIVEFTIYCAVFASFAYSQRQNAHVHIYSLMMLFPRKLRFFCSALTGILACVIVFYLTYAAYMQGHTALRHNYTTGVLRIPLHPLSWLQVATLTAFSLTLLFSAIKNLVAIFDDETAKEIQATWV